MAADFRAGSRPRHRVSAVHVSGDGAVRGRERPCVCARPAASSAAYLAEISVTSPRKLFIFII